MCRPSANTENSRRKEKPLVLGVNSSTNEEKTPENTTLMLNDDKTELMLIGTRQQLQKVNLNDITVGDTVVEAKSVVRNLGSWFDRNLDMSSHISKQCASAFYHLHNISRIRRFLSTDTTKAPVHAFVTSRVDYLVHEPRHLKNNFRGTPSKT